jgi:hypothetical protein
MGSAISIFDNRPFVPETTSGRDQHGRIARSRLISMKARHNAIDHVSTSEEEPPVIWGAERKLAQVVAR